MGYVKDGEDGLEVGAELVDDVHRPLARRIVLALGVGLGKLLNLKKYDFETILNQREQFLRVKIGVKGEECSQRQIVRLRDEDKGRIFQKRGYKLLGLAGGRVGGAESGDLGEVQGLGAAEALEVAHVGDHHVHVVVRLAGQLRPRVERLKIKLLMK